MEATLFEGRLELRLGFEEEEAKRFLVRVADGLGGVLPFTNKATIAGPSGPSRSQSALK